MAKQEKPTPYRLVRSARKSCAVEIKPSGEIVMHAPKKMPLSAIERFYEQSLPWIEKAEAKMRERQKIYAQIVPLTESELVALKEKGKTVFKEKADFYAARMGVSFESITIRSQKTRWGSCSSKGNLNFNCLLLLAPEEVLDYVVVHELSHRLEMNHSAAFWQKVEAVLPDYKVRRRWLKENGTALLAKLPK